LGSTIAAGSGFTETSAQILAGSIDSCETIVSDPDPGIPPVEIIYGNQVNFGWRLK
jgi:hypothetical protein